MKKLSGFVVSVFLSTAIGAFYGGFHNQITFSISPEYFTVLKFPQFGYEDWQVKEPRIAAAIVGCLSTWWVGTTSGLALSMLALWSRKGEQMISFTLNAVLTIVITSVIFSSVGAFVSYFSLVDTPSCFPYPVNDCRNFRIVSSLHNFGYAGAFTGLLLALIVEVRRMMRFRNLQRTLYPIS